MSESDEQYIERLARGWEQEVAKFDRTLLTLATGALALSVPLVRDLAQGDADPVSIHLVPIGWISLLLAPVLVLISYAISKAAIEARWLHDEAKGNKRSGVAWSVTLAAGFLFIIGAGIIMYFVWLNIR